MLTRKANFEKLAKQMQRQQPEIAKNPSRGQAIVEFTLIFPILVVLVGAVTDWGLFFYASHIAQNASREAVRKAAVDPSANHCSAGQSWAQNYITKVGGPLSSPTVTCTHTVIPPCGDELNMKVTGTYSFYFLRLIGFTTRAVEYKTTMRYEWQPFCT